MKVAIITDTHFGVRNDNRVFANYIDDFFKYQFFPYLKEHDIKHVVHLGDLVDKRKVINYRTLDQVNDFLFNIKYLDIVAGNHDCYYKNTNIPNALEELVTDQYHNVYSNHCGFFLETDGFVLCPWICPDNYEYIMNQLEKTTAQVLMGHFEINGFNMNSGIVCENGLDKKIFDKFDLVFSGHFHQKSQSGSIHYLGAPYEMTWADCGQERGFYIFDTETRELEFIRNNNRMFHRIEWDNTPLNVLPLEEYENRYVKVIVKNKDNQEKFDHWLETLNDVSPASVQVIENSLNLLLEDEDEILDTDKDTLSIIRKYVNQIDVDDKKELERVMIELYNEATSS